MHALGGRLGQTIGQELHHHLLIGVVIEIGLQTDIHRRGKDPDTVFHTGGKRTEEIRQTEIRLSDRRRPLLAQQRDPGTPDDDVIAIAVGLENLEQGIHMITALQIGEAGLCLPLQASLLGGVLHLPGKEEIRPVDIRRQLRDIVNQSHLSTTLSPRSPENTTGCPI